jgi:hypothetical protein
MTHSTTENSIRPREHTRPNRIACADRDTDRVTAAPPAIGPQKSWAASGTGNDMPNDCRDP